MTRRWGIELYCAKFLIIKASDSTHTGFSCGMGVLTRPLIRSLPTPQILRNGYDRKVNKTSKIFIKC
ncbi:hypothetical protein NSP_52860 [Nodularia spumigena CCY9414]|nr:hypothetical protein NSP_52860 [Nodularia spumigena CCY9414]